MEIDRQNQVFFILTIILTLVGFGFDGKSVLQYGLIALLTIFLRNKYFQDNDKVMNSNYRRMAWLFTRLSPIDPSLRFNAKRIHELIPTAEIITIKGLEKAELGIQTFEMPQENQLPDLSYAEVALAKIEERASIILGSLVFIPILFALIHLFRFVPLFSFLLEILVAIMVGLTLLESQKVDYELTGWDTIFSFLTDNQFELTINPRQFLIEHSLTKSWFLPQKIGYDTTPQQLNPAEFFLYLISKILIELEPDIRSVYLRRILMEIEPLPGKEEIVTEKWKAYKVRLFLISISSTALAGLFSSISSFNVQLIGTDQFQLTTTPYLVWGEFILVICLNMAVLRLWYDNKRTIGYGAILVIIYFGMYFLNSLLV